MTTKLSDLVRHPATGEVTTIAALADRGEIEFRSVNRFAGRSGKVRKAYFADIKGTSQGWEIGKLAYQSRTACTVDLGGSEASTRHLNKPAPR